MNTKELITKLIAGDLTKEERLVMTHLIAKFGWRVIVFAFIAFAMGWLQTIGLAGFVRANEMAEIRSGMAQVKSALQTRRIQEISGLMLDSKQKHCIAKGEAKRLYLESLNRLRDEYYALTQRWASDPPCSDFE